MDLEDLNRMTRKNFTNHKAHLPHSSVEYFHIPRSVCGRDVTDMGRIHFKLVNGLREYSYISTETNALYSSVIHIDKRYTVRNLRDRCQAGTKVALGEMMQL